MDGSPSQASADLHNLALALDAGEPSPWSLSFALAHLGAESQHLWGGSGGHVEHVVSGLLLYSFLGLDDEGRGV